MTVTDQGLQNATHQGHPDRIGFLTIRIIAFLILTITTKLLYFSQSREERCRHRASTQRAKYRVPRVMIL